MSGCVCGGVGGVCGGCEGVPTLPLCLPKPLAWTPIHFYVTFLKLFEKFLVRIFLNLKMMFINLIAINFEFHFAN